MYSSMLEVRHFLLFHRREHDVIGDPRCFECLEVARYSGFARLQGDLVPHRSMAKGFGSQRSVYPVVIVLGLYP